MYFFNKNKDDNKMLHIKDYELEENNNLSFSNIGNYTRYYNEKPKIAFDNNENLHQLNKLMPLLNTDDIKEFFKNVFN